MESPYCVLRSPSGCHPGIFASVAKGWEVKGLIFNPRAASLSSEISVLCYLTS